MVLALVVCITALAQAPQPRGVVVAPLPMPTVLGGAEIIYVDANANGFENGTTWGDAFKDLTDGIAAADTDDEIWVAMGTYKPTNAGGSRSISFLLVDDVAIYGGFAGSETMREQRNPSIYVTTLTGDLNGDDGPNFLNNGENSYHVVSAGSGIGATAILDGFWIRGGFADGGGADGQGAGLKIDTGTPTIRDCVITENKAVNRGGGVHIINSSGSVLRSNRIMYNEAGGVMGGSGIALANSTAFVTGCHIFSNTSTTVGGGLSATGGGTVYVTNCIFSDNEAPSGGGINVGTSVTMNVTNSLFYRNKATGAGGDGGAITSIGTALNVVNSTFTLNDAVDGGGGIHLGPSSSNGSVFNSILWNNTDGTGVLSFAQIRQQGGSLSVGWSIVESATPSMFIPSVDPQFMNPTVDDYRLQSNSPAIDFGNNSFVPADVADVDNDANTAEPVPLGLGGIGRFADNPYVADTGVGNAPLVDLGAYEVRAIYYIYVDGDGLPGTGEWAFAFDNLQDALIESQSAATSEIWVADGTYYPDMGGGVTSGDRTATFQLSNHVGIYGGFAGDETMRSQRDPLANISILSGDLAGDDGPSFTNYAENSYHVVIGIGTDSTAILDGFTVTGGNANGAGIQLYGGGLFVDNGDPAVAQCLFTLNSASLGGGVFVWNGSNPTIENCTFDGNRATTQGGGMYNSGSSHTTINDSIFRNNNATGDAGGGLFNALNSNPVLTNCQFFNNTAVSNGGGMVNLSNCNPRLENCTFLGNEATHGGGFHNNASDAILVGCVFGGNYGSLQGGAISSINGSDLKLFNCRFNGNTSDDGGGVHNTSSLLATNCVFDYNSGLVGGAVRTTSNPAFVNCTFFNNSAASTGGLHSDSGSVLVANSIFWDNDDKGGGGQGAQIHIGSGTLDIDYSIVDGLTGSFGGTGNIGSDPKFVSSIDSDYRLQPESPAIDAAHTPSVPTDAADLDGDANTGERVPLDANGSARFFDDPDTTNTGVPSFPAYPVVVDMGAFEYFGSDCNQNNIPDICDISCGFANGPCDVPGCGMSTDLDSNMVPDECADFVGGCGSGMDENWSCFNNWFIPGDVYPDNSMSQSYDVLLDMDDNVFLDVDVIIDSLLIKDEAKLRMTQTGSAGDLIIATDKGLKLMGMGPMSTQLLTAGNRMITLLCGPVTVLNAFYGPSPTAPPGSVNSILNCETLRITQPSGQVRLEDSMSINASVDLVLDGRGATPCTSDGGKTTPIKRVFDNGSVNIGGNFTLDGNTDFNNASSVNMNVGGSFFNTGDTADCFDCSQGGVTLMGSGMQTFEVSGEDLGATMNGFVHPTGNTNFSWQDIEVTGGTGHVVRFQNGDYNGFGWDPCTEALYVRRLSLQSGATIVIEDVKVYYLNLLNNGATINTIGCGQLVPVQVPCTLNQQCDDSAVCSYDDCHMGFCRFTELEYGNVNGMGPTNPNLDDILCVLAGFANMNSCTNGDIRGSSDTPCVPNNIISLDDILAVLGAFGGADLCGCVP